MRIDRSSQQEATSSKKHVRGLFRITIFLSNVDQQINDTGTISPFVVVPGNKLDKVIVQADPGLSIENRRSRVPNKVGRDNGILGIFHDALQGALGSFFDGLLDVGVRGRFLKSDSQVDDRNIGGGDPEGHASEFTIEGGNDFADCLCCTGGGGDDVCGGGATATPVLVGGAVDGLLCGCGGVDGGHETLDDAVLVIDDLRRVSIEAMKRWIGRGVGSIYLCERSKTVGGAASVADDLVFRFVGIEVDATDKHGSIGRGCRDDNLLCSTLEMGRSLVLGGEDAGRFDNVLKILTSV